MSEKPNCRCRRKNLLRLSEQRRSDVVDLGVGEPARLHAPHGLPLEHVVQQFDEGEHEPDEAVGGR